MATNTPSSPASEVAGWLSNITKTFNGRTETGVDIGMPYHTPVYSLVSGPVVGAGYYGGGGVVTVQSQVQASNYNNGLPSLANVYVQHLSDINVAPGQYVQQGQLIGYSGGQLGYGDHPSTTQYSTGPHIEVGLNAPYGGIWGSGAGPNVNPTPFLQNVMGGVGGAMTGLGGDIATSIQAAITGLGATALGAVGANTLKDLMWRALLIVVAIILLWLGVQSLLYGGDSQGAVVRRQQREQKRGERRQVAEFAIRAAAAA